MKLVKYTVLIICSFLHFEVLAESAWDGSDQTLEKPVAITVYRSPTCGCCSKWVAHLEKHGFNVQDLVTDDMDAIKQKYRIPAQLASCHTAVADGYVFEGHVPAGDIKNLLKQKPDIAGLTVPGMPSGTPGMEMGGRKDAFGVIAFDRDGQMKIFNRYDDY